MSGLGATEGIVQALACLPSLAGSSGPEAATASLHPVGSDGMVVAALGRRRGALAGGPQGWRPPALQRPRLGVQAPGRHPTLVHQERADRPMRSAERPASASLPQEMLCSLERTQAGILDIGGFPHP